MIPDSDYTPPASSAMLKTQDTLEALRLLIAQRRLYRRAKRWLAFRWFGMAVIGVFAPIVSVLNPGMAVWAGAIAGLWLFLGRTLIELIQAATTVRAAAVQEQFDVLVFGMPESIDRSALPTLEEIAKIAGPDESIPKVARKEKLVAWYPMVEAYSGALSVAVSQRSNAAYANQLMRATAIVWGIVTMLWTIGIIAASVLVGLSLLMFIAGVLLPLLPALLDIGEHVTGIWRAAKERADLTRTIEKRVRSSAAINAQDLLVWQSRLYELRCSSPEVPDFIYAIKRKSNERTMHSAARQLSQKAQGRSGTS